MDKVTLAVLFLVDELGHLPRLHVVLLVGVVALLDDVHFLPRLLRLPDRLVALRTVLQRAGEDGVPLLLHGYYSRTWLIGKMDDEDQALTSSRTARAGLFMPLIFLSPLLKKLV